MALVRLHMSYDMIMYLKSFRTFGKCYIRRDDKLGKFDPRSDEGILTSYSTKTKAYKCYIFRLKNLVESAHVKVD